VLVEAHDHTGSVGLTNVMGQQHAATGADIQRRGAELVPHHHHRTRVPGRDRVPVAAKRHQGLIADRPLGLQHGRERGGHRAQRLGVHDGR
jgi:hypothetical protein